MLGILTYELLLGAAPFGGDGMDALHTSILSQPLNFSPAYVDDDAGPEGGPSEAIVPPKISSEAEDFCICEKPSSPQRRR